MMTVSLPQCRNGTAGHSSVGEGKSLLGPTIAMGPFPQLSVAPYGQMPVPIQLLQCSKSFHCSLFFRDFPMLRYGLRILSTRLQICGVYFVQPSFKDIPRSLRFFQARLHLLCVGLRLFLDRPLSLVARHSYWLPLLPEWPLS
jgi:hypothetical protein